MIRAVLDTNVVVSGIIKGGSPPGRISAALFQRRFIAVTSSALLTEAARVLSYPKISRRYHLERETINSIMTSLTLVSDCVETPKVSWKASPDPDDDLFLACALQGNADYVVTGDQDFRSMGSFQGVQLITAESFLKLLRT